jgi:hypothetical protein
MQPNAASGRTSRSNADSLCQVLLGKQACHTEHPLASHKARIHTGPGLYGLRGRRIGVSVLMRWRALRTGRLEQNQPFSKWARKPRRSSSLEETRQTKHTQSDNVRLERRCNKDALPHDFGESPPCSPCPSWLKRRRHEQVKRWISSKTPR